MQFSPAAVFCENNCIYCWRPMEFMKILEMEDGGVNSPEEIFKNLSNLRKKLLSGFLGNSLVNKDKFFEGNVPNHFAISLSGEPMLYPKLPDLVKFLRNLPKTKSIFVVSNGQEPEMAEKLQKKDALPTQLYLSMNAPDELLFDKINKPRHKDGWERHLKSLEILSKLKTRRVSRLTMIKGLNTNSFKNYSELIKMANPHFVEVKAYMFLGYSRRRLEMKNMPSHQEVSGYGEKLLNYLPNFQKISERVASRIVLLENLEEKIDRKIRNPIPNL
jgi:tRNA wybutosine-synthesizing protein 1